MTKQAFRQAFTRGFAAQLAERGWTPGNIEEVLLKSSGLLPSYKDVSDNLRAIAGDVKDVSKFGLIVGGGLAGLAGGTLGYLAADPQRVSDADLEAMRDQDLIGAYRQAVRSLRLPKLPKTGVVV